MIETAVSENGGAGKYTKQVLRSQNQPIRAPPSKKRENNIGPGCEILGRMYNTGPDVQLDYWAGTVPADVKQMTGENKHKRPYQAIFLCIFGNY